MCRVPPGARAGGAQAPRRRRGGALLALALLSLAGACGQREGDAPPAPRRPSRALAAAVGGDFDWPSAGQPLAGGWRWSDDRQQLTVTFAGGRWWCSRLLVVQLPVSDVPLVHHAADVLVAAELRHDGAEVATVALTSLRGTVATRPTGRGLLVTLEALADFDGERATLAAEVECLASVPVQGAVADAYGSRTRAAARSSSER